MPAILDDDPATRHASTTVKELPFPPVTKSHILNCSYHSWHSRYRTISPKARLVALPPPFLAYLRADGIILPEDEVEQRRHSFSDHDSGVFSASEATDDEDEQEDVAAEWRETHDTIKTVIEELGGNVVPKLNWSAPKDATWMNANSMECRAPNDVYLLLKSSDFVTHDLEHAFDECVDSPGKWTSAADIPYHLVLRKAAQFNPSVEFRCFVRNRKLLGMCQRDLNHFEFLEKMEGQLRSVIQEFFDVRLRDTFPDDSFVFDVYVPAPHSRVWLVDINPWAPRTDPLLFSWLELLNMPEPPSVSDEALDGFVRLSINKDGTQQGVENEEPEAELDTDDAESEADEELWLPELRLVRRTDPEAYSFSTQQYSAHKLPKDVVDASQSGEGLREFARDWRNILAKRQQEDAEASSDDETTR